jgi:AcrR family transcriptional regulator
MPGGGSKKSAVSKRRVVSEFRTGEILEASRRVFARNGFEAALVGDIAAEAGIAKGTVYLYFKSKTEIYRAALREDLLALGLAKREAVAKANGGTREQLRAYITTIFEYCDRRKDFFRIFLLESGSLRNALMYSAKEMKEQLSDQVLTLKDLLQGAKERGEMRDLNLQFATNAVDAMLKGVIERRLLGPVEGGVFCKGPEGVGFGARPVGEEVDLVVDFLWNGLNPGVCEKNVGRRKMR